MHLSIIPPQHSLPLVSPLEQRGGGTEREGGRERGQLLKKKKTPLHTFFFAVIMFRLLCVMHALICPVGVQGYYVVIRVVFTPIDAAQHRTVFTYIAKLFLFPSILVPDILCYTPSFFRVTVMRCVPGSISPRKEEEKKSAVGLLPFEWPEHVPGCAGQDPTGRGAKTWCRMRVGGLYSCFNGLHAVYTGLILEQSPLLIHTSTTTRHTAPFSLRACITSFLVNIGLAGWRKSNTSIFL